MAHILVLNGPNLNMLGKREPEIYGSASLQDIETLCNDTAGELGITVTCQQSNAESELIEAIQQADGSYDGLILNAAAYTHTSIAIHDALKTLQLPIIELHISNIYNREPFRHTSYVSPVATGIICGLGINGYKHALYAMKDLL